MPHVVLSFFFSVDGDNLYLHVRTHSFPTRRSSDLNISGELAPHCAIVFNKIGVALLRCDLGKQAMLDAAVSDSHSRILAVERERTVHALVRDRKSVVSGKSVSVRVDLGGRRIIKKKKQERSKNVNNTNTKKSTRSEIK